MIIFNHFTQIAKSAGRDIVMLTHLISIIKVAYLSLHHRIVVLKLRYNLQSINAKQNMLPDNAIERGTMNKNSRSEYPNLIFIGARSFRDHVSHHVTQLFDNGCISRQSMSLAVVKHVSDIRVAGVVQCQGTTNVRVQRSDFR